MARVYSLREPRKKLFIISEGKKTERTYFINYRKRGCGLEIKTPNTSKTDPLNLLEFAKRQIIKYDLNINEGDEVWCVFDVNSNDDDVLHRAFTIAESSGIKIALSNPCFEIWFLLHFELRQTGLSCDDTIDNLKKYLQDYSKDEDIFHDILDKRQIAVSNAKKLNSIHMEERKNDLNSSKGNPSTQVFRLIEYILEYTECDG